MATRRPRIVAGKHKLECVTRRAPKKLVHSQFRSRRSGAPEACRRAWRHHLSVAFEFGGPFRIRPPAGQSAHLAATLDSHIARLMGIGLFPLAGGGGLCRPSSMEAEQP